MMKRQTLGERFLGLMTGLVLLAAMAPPATAEEAPAAPRQEVHKIKDAPLSKEQLWKALRQFLRQSEPPVTIQIKFLEMSSGDHELSFDWLMPLPQPASPPPQPPTTTPQEHHDTPILDGKIDDLLYQKIPAGVTGNR